MTPTELLAPTFRQMLRTLAGWLDKAEAARGPDALQALLSARLAPDMFPLATQIRFACVQPWEAVHRLTGQAFPPAIAALRNEGVDAGERPGTMAEARSRIDETIALLDRLEPAALDMPDDAPVAHDLPMGMIFDMTAAAYARDWALPQFYFHLMIAYAILRREGIALGKVDYVPHMFAWLRPGTMPGA